MNDAAQAIATLPAPAARMAAVEILLADFTDRPLSCTGRPPSLLLGAPRTDLPSWPEMSATFACNHGRRSCGARHARASPR
jgi:hypothetical protein